MSKQAGGGDPLDWPTITTHIPPLDLLVKALRHRHRGPPPTFPDLPGAAWKRLFLLAVGRMARTQRQLATLCALEALSLRDCVTWTGPHEMGANVRGSADLRFIAYRLREFGQRPVGRGRLKARRWPPPLYLHLCYRQARGALLADAASNNSSALTEALQALWARWNKDTLGARRPQKAEIEAVILEPAPAARALDLVGRAFGYTPESLKTIFAKAQLSLSLPRQMKASTHRRNGKAR